MTPIQNLDLISVGMAIAGILVLGFMIFFSNRKSITNRTFLYLSCAISLWSFFNYFFYQFKDSELSLWLLRFVIFFAVWFAFFLFQLLFIFPKETPDFPRLYKNILLLIVVLTSLLTLTPFVFSNVGAVSASGQITRVVNGPGITAFGLVTAGLDLFAIYFLIGKTIRAKGIEKRQFVFVLLGVVITIFLILIFNFILPAFFDNPRFIPLGAVFIFPFVALTAYAIFRHHLLSVKVITTEVVAFLLTIATLFEVVLSSDPLVLIFRSGVFVLVLSFSILLIRSVLKEVEQRERLQELTEELKAKNAQLDELSHFKTQLLSIASHQIRSPLAAIKGFGSLLLDGTYGKISTKVRETIGKMKKSTDELLALINTLLDFRKVEEGRMEYQFAPTDLGALVGEVVENLRSLAVEKKLDFRYAPPSERVMVNADTQKLKQVIQNLADNAIKYTPAGFVHVNIKTEGGLATISVEDSGLGISPELVPHLFEEFIRDEKVKNKILGTGLGLYIARRMLEAHGGKLWAESEGEGKGSKFHVQLKVI